jgi:hypothetical protein
MFRRVDRSVRLSRLLDRTSDTVSRQRGLPVVIGIVLVIVSFILQSVNVFADSNFLALLGVIALHLGVLTALIGLLMVNPLGR